MHFGIFSNGFRAHTTAGATYEEDIREIVLADQLGFRDAYISEHHGEPQHIGRVDTIPIPELMMAKAAALTRNIRMGSAVKLIHLEHPLNVAVQAAVTDHLLGPGRYILGIGTGFATPRFSEARGLSFEDRHARFYESLELILRCWREEQPFDFQGTFWRGNGVLALPKPCFPQGPAMAVATDSDATIKLAAERGYSILMTHIDMPERIRARSAKYLDYAAQAGRSRVLDPISVTRLVYIADTREQALGDIRQAVTFEIGIQAERGFLAHMKRAYGVDVPNNEKALDALVEAGLYMVGDADQVATQLERFYHECGGWGTLLLIAGKSWSTAEKRGRSMRLFMQEVAPRLRLLHHASAA